MYFREVSTSFCIQAVLAAPLQGPVAALSTTIESPICWAQGCVTSVDLQYKIRVLDVAMQMRLGMNAKKTYVHPRVLTVDGENIESVFQSRQFIQWNPNPCGWYMDLGSLLESLECGHAPATYQPHGYLKGLPMLIRATALLGLMNILYCKSTCQQMCNN